MLEGSRAKAFELQQRLIELLPSSFDVQVAKDVITSSYIAFYLIVSKGSMSADLRWGDTHISTNDSISFIIERHYETNPWDARTAPRITGVKNVVDWLIDEFEER